jgi:hypothetical protein
MPSQVVDDAWHEFILFTRQYQQFCERGLGRFLHHTPAEAMRSPTDAQDGIKRAWRLACRRDGIDPKAPQSLPLLLRLTPARDHRGFCLSARLPGRNPRRHGLLRRPHQLRGRLWREQRLWWRQRRRRVRRRRLWRGRVRWRWR